MSSKQEKSIDKIISDLRGKDYTDVSKPIEIIFMDMSGKWTIAALIFREKPHLGIRWITTEVGFPKKGWFIIPNTLEKPILDVLNLEPNDRKLIDNFLSNSNNINLINGINTVIINRV